MKYKCPHCGRINLSMYCDTCNKGLSSACAVTVGELSYETAQSPSAGDRFMYRDEAKEKRSRAIRILLIVVAAILILFVLSAISPLQGQSFPEMFPELVSMGYCTMGSDGSWMILDTNPRDIDLDSASDEEKFVHSAITSSCSNKIEAVNKALGFSSGLMQKMNTTTWSMGRQSDSNGKYSVSWTYHPDKGLEVMYEIVK